MFEKSCRCGASKKNFKIDIGEFFIADCCTEAGYDHLGKKAVDASDLGLDSTNLENQLNSEATQNLQIDDEGEQPDLNEDEAQPQQADAQADESSEDLDSEEAKLEAEQLAEDAAIEQAENTPIEPETKLEVTEEGAIVQAGDEAKPEKKKRQYNRGGNIKK